MSISLGRCPLAPRVMLPCVAAHCVGWLDTGNLIFSHGHLLLAPVFGALLKLCGTVLLPKFRALWTHRMLSSCAKRCDALLIPLLQDTPWRYVWLPSFALSPGMLFQCLLLQRACPMVPILATCLPAHECRWMGPSWWCQLQMGPCLKRGSTFCWPNRCAVAPGQLHHILPYTSSNRLAPLSHPLLSHICAAPGLPRCLSQ